jgi:hypothetical protein
LLPAETPPIVVLPAAEDPQRPHGTTERRPHASRGLALGGVAAVLAGAGGIAYGEWASDGWIYDPDEREARDKFLIAMGATVGGTALVATGGSLALAAVIVRRW